MAKVISSPSRRRPRSRSGWMLAALTAGLLVTACGSSSDPAPPTTRVKATLTASADVNPDLNGEPSPVFVRVYELKSAGAFNRASFRDLFDNEAATLGADVVSRETVVLKPGGSSTVQMTFQPGSTVMGVIASYQDIDRATWRSSVPVTGNLTNPFRVSIGRDAVDVLPGGG